MSDPAERRCDCGATPEIEPHFQGCPHHLTQEQFRSSALQLMPYRVRRLATDDAGRRLEDLLEACTKQAYVAWLVNGASHRPRRAPPSSRA